MRYSERVVSTSSAAGALACAVTSIALCIFTAPRITPTTVNYGRSAAAIAAWVAMPAPLSLSGSLRAAKSHTFAFKIAHERPVPKELGGSMRDALRFFVGAWALFLSALAMVGLVFLLSYQIARFVP